MCGDGEVFLDSLCDGIEQIPSLMRRPVISPTHAIAPFQGSFDTSNALYQPDLHFLPQERCSAFWQRSQDMQMVSIYTLQR